MRAPTVRSGCGFSPRRSSVLKPGRYQHYKGNHYEVLGVAKHSETEEELVVYRALYGEHGLWVRPLCMFTECIPHEGVCIKRFEYIGEVREPR
ncbi:MAG: DUF1653 domain-containing protein [Campylobacterales bacterium]|nr:DUF1653 domain-containing protein [Campylobacterales bacterium]